MPLPATLLQDDFSGGMFRGIARHLIPGNGAYDLVNSLLDDDGSTYRRGGTDYKSAVFTGEGSLTFCWDGFLAAAVGRRTVVASGSKFGVLAANDSDIVDLGGSGVPASAPTRAVVVENMLVIGGGTLYGGSRKTADYSTGTVAVTNGSTAVTGAGTTWSTNVDVGMLLRVPSGDGRYYVVTAVGSNTSITLDRPYRGFTAGSSAYALTRLGSAGKGSLFYGTVQDRLLAGSGNRTHFSSVNSLTAQSDIFTFGANDWHEHPMGADVLGYAEVRDTALVFTTVGVFAISNLAYDIVSDTGDPQHRAQLVTGDVVLWGQAGIAPYAGAVVVPAMDGVWVIDGISPPERISRSVDALLKGYVRAGYKPGGALVFGAYYLLPVLTAGGAWLDTLVCRLDRPTETRIGRTWPWARIAGSGAEARHFTGRGGGGVVPELYAAASTVGRLLNCRLFEPSANAKNDADGTAFAWEVSTRDFRTGSSRANPNRVRRVAVRYELADAATDDPVIAAFISTGGAAGTTPLWGAATWGSFSWSEAEAGDWIELPGRAPETRGRDPFTWRAGQGGRGRYVRLRLRSSDPAAKLVLRSMELFSYPTRKV